MVVPPVSKVVLLVRDASMSNIPSRQHWVTLEDLHGEKKGSFDVWSDSPHAASSWFKSPTALLIVTPVKQSESKNVHSNWVVLKLSVLKCIQLSLLEA
jgi:hypothetical protein